MIGLAREVRRQGHDRVGAGRAAEDAREHRGRRGALEDALARRRAVQQQHGLARGERHPPHGAVRPGQHAHEQVALGQERVEHPVAGRQHARAPPGGARGGARIGAGRAQAHVTGTRRAAGRRRQVGSVSQK